MNSYLSLDEINKVLDTLLWSRKHVTVETSFISPLGIKPALDKSILVDGGIHAREWIAVTSALHIAAWFAFRENWPENVDVYVVPVVNPDGYEYSRHDPTHVADEPLGRRQGTSGAPCTEIYRGFGPESEPEARALAAFMRANRKHLKAYVSLHAYDNSVLWPYGYERGALPANHVEIARMGKRMVEAMNAVHGNNYTTKNSAELYPAAGGSDDYAKSLGIRYSYTVELTTGFYQKQYVGFEAPVEMIQPTADEIIAAIRVLVDDVSTGP
ncbi:Carboxypeptidase B-like [Aphelenchoides fujianensis]|nr:Carboxypeptidase B-like [Aphelenchoides fujianensis]